MESAALLSIFQAGVIPPLLIGIAIWNSDKFISEDGARLLYSHIHNSADKPAQSKASEIIESYLKNNLSPRNFIKFSINVFVLTCISLAIFLAVYTTKTTGFYSYLTSSGFTNQFLGNGFVVTYITNCFIFSVYPLFLNKFIQGSILNGFLLIIFDQILKIIIFLILTAITYIWFAEFRGAFSGSKVLALKAIPDTIILGLKFGNLTSVYIYSLLLSSFPLFIVFTIKLMVSSAGARNFIKIILFWLPLKNKPLRAIGCIFAIFCGIFTVLISFIVNLIPN